MYLGLRKINEYMMRIKSNVNSCFKIFKKLNSLSIWTKELKSKITYVQFSLENLTENKKHSFMSDKKNHYG